MWQRTMAVLLALAFQLIAGNSVYAQSPEAGDVSSTTIPGTDVTIETVFLPGGTFDFERGAVKESSKALRRYSVLSTMVFVLKQGQTSSGSSSGFCIAISTLLLPVGHTYRFGDEPLQHRNLVTILRKRGRAGTNLLL